MLDRSSPLQCRAIRSRTRDAIPWALVLYISALCALALPARAAGKSYVDTVLRANALKKAGQYDQAIALYVDALTRQQALCRTSAIKGALSALPQDAPCWRQMKVQFNIALTRRAQEKHDLAAKAFASYLAQWRGLFPKEKFYPWQERARFEIAQANYALKRWALALDSYREALSRWQSRYPKKRARFADVALRRIAESLEQLARRKDAAAAYERFLARYQADHKSAHPDTEHLKRRITTLRKKGKTPPTTRKGTVRPPAQRPRSTAWLITAIASTAIALGGEALAIAFTIKANDTFDDLPEFATRRGIAVAGHAIAGAAAIGAALSYYFYFKSGREQALTASMRPQILAGPGQAVLRWTF